MSKWKQEESLNYLVIYLLQELPVTYTIQVKNLHLLKSVRATSGHTHTVASVGAEVATIAGAGVMGNTSNSMMEL